jgi:N-acetylneuraminic acid mutarotase
MTWQEITSDVHGKAPEARGWHSMSAVDHRLFVFGGYNGSAPFQDLHVLDTETMVWSQPETHGAAPSPRYSHAAVVHGKFLLLIGGANGNKSFNECCVLNTGMILWVLCGCVHM